MSLRRRDFLTHGVALATSPLLARASGLAMSVARRPDALATARIIWSAATPPVPIETGGTAAKISSSASGQGLAPASDLHCIFARQFALAETPTKAALHLFTFTRYRLYVNGTYIGRGPCRYQNQRPEYDSREILDHLHPGQNTLVVLVHRDAPTGRIMHHDPGFIATLDLTVGGNRQTIGTDASWLAMPDRSFGPRVQAWSSIEENLDARKTIEWTRPDLTLPIWKTSEVILANRQIPFFPRGTPLQQETEQPWAQGAPALPADLSTGSVIEFSLPAIAQAFHLFEMTAREGSALEVAYLLPQGDTTGKSTYISREGEQTWMGGDTFAFLRLRLRVVSGAVRLTRSAAFEVRYPFERVAAFECSDPFFDRLWTICARSLEILSEDAYVDCADRERVEWTDCSPPAFDCTRVMMRGPDHAKVLHWGDARLLQGLLRRIALTQQPDGQLKAHSCSDRFDIHAIMEDRTCDWIVLLRQYSESCRDTALLHELWPTLLRLLAWYRPRTTERGLVLAREWEVWDNPLRYQVCEGAGLNAMVYRALVDAAILAGTIGRTQDAGMLTRQAQRLQKDFNRLLWNEAEGAYDGALFGKGSEIHTQQGRPFLGPVVDGRFQPTAQANLFAVYSGIVPTERLPSVRAWVLRHLDQVREPMSYYYLFQMLYGMEDRAQDDVVLRLIRTGWKKQVDSQWRTSWEGLEEGGASRIHIYGIHPGYFLTAYVLGVRREGPLERRTIVIEPRFSGLAWAKGCCVTEFGPVPIMWTSDAQGCEIHCDIPAAVHATLRLPMTYPDAALEINDRVRSPRAAGGWLETALSAGKQTIRLRHGVRRPTPEGDG